MKKEIIAQDKEHLTQLIEDEIKLHGHECDLNHLDVSGITDISWIFNIYEDFNGKIDRWDVSQVSDMSGLFFKSKFNGDISNWDVSSVKQMKELFANSYFDGNISNWNTSNVENMRDMFFNHDFTGDISRWNVEKVKDMQSMFEYSNFTGDLSLWKPLSLINYNEMFNCSSAIIPYWFNYTDKEKRNLAIEYYHNAKNLEASLAVKQNTDHRVKI